MFDQSGGCCDGASFSLEIPMSVRFVTKSRVFTFEETQNLIETKLGDMI